MVRIERLLGVGTVGGLGVLLFSLHLSHLPREDELLALVLGGIIPLVHAVALVGAGVWLAERPMEDRHTLGVAAATVVGAVFGAALGVGVIVYMQVEGGAGMNWSEVHLEYVAVSLATIGAVPGCLLGVLRARCSESMAENRETERQLRRAEMREEQFASVLGDHLRTPLNVAKGRLKMARANHDSDHLEAVSRAQDRMERIIDDAVTLAHQDGSLADRETVELHAVATEAWAQVPTPGVALEVTSSRRIDAHSGWLRRLLEQLFQNAVEHGGDDLTRVRVGTTERGFYVADDGKGIPSQLHDRIFDSGISTGERGTGLGLAIARDVAVAHGWTIEATDSESGGARLEIDLEAETGPEDGDSVVSRFLEI